MSYHPGETLYVTIKGEEREVEFERETADGLLLVREDVETRYTVGGGEVTARELTFGVYPDIEEPFAVINEERPDIPRGTLMDIQDEVDEAMHDDRLTVDGELPEAGTVTYEPGKANGQVRDVQITAED